MTTTHEITRHPHFVQYLALTLALALISLDAFGETVYNLRCGSRLVNIGDSTGRLIEYCGQPTNVEKNEVRKPVETWDSQLQKTITTYEVQPYEIWKYNFGPSRLTSTITVQNGAIQGIETGGYGW